MKGVTGGPMIAVQNSAHGWDVRFAPATTGKNVAHVDKANTQDRLYAHLFAEAGTVHHETGLSPRELVAQRDALVEELRIIAEANPAKWDPEMRDQFQPWAQNRARDALAKVTK